MAVTTITIDSAISSVPVVYDSDLWVDFDFEDFFGDLLDEEDDDDDHFADIVDDILDIFADDEDDDDADVPLASLFDVIDCNSDTTALKCQNLNDHFADAVDDVDITDS